MVRASLDGNDWTDDTSIMRLDAGKWQVWERDIKARDLETKRSHFETRPKRDICSSRDVIEKSSQA